MKKILYFIFFAAIFCLSVNAWASEKMKEATVEYSADRAMESQQVSINGKVYHALGGKERQEMTVQGTTQIMITRMDKKVIWSLMPAQKTYMEMSLEASTQQTGTTDVNNCDMNFNSLGDETVNGVKATNNKVSMSCPDNSNFNGNIWITKEGIMVKMDAVGGQGSTQERVKIDLKNLKIAKQDPSLFEIPAGYQKFNMGDISSMMKSAQDEAAKAQVEADKAQAEADKKARAEATDDTGRAYTAQGRDYTAKPGALETVDEKTDDTNKALDETDKVKDTVNRLKGLFGR